MSKKINLVAFIHNYDTNDYDRGIITGGAWNGYVAIPPTHMCYGKSDYDLSNMINVHGGVTFSVPAVNAQGHSAEYYFNKVRKVEFITENTHIPKDWWIIGFDTKHCDDTPETWTKEATIEETKRLLKQLEAMADAKLTYDVVLDGKEPQNFRATENMCRSFIKEYKYCKAIRPEYNPATVAEVVCNETKEIVYKENLK